MKCVICKTHFSHMSWSSPAEDCDCGQCVNQTAYLQMSNQEVSEARENWKKRQEDSK